MKANELRVGNLVECDVIRYGHLKKGDLFQISLDELQDAEYFKPIPLTEDWLIKFRFDMSNEYDDKFKGDYGYCLKDKSLGLQYSHDEGTLRIDCEYVHTLQNLYFALTGEELTINELT